MDVGKILSPKFDEGDWHPIPGTKARVKIRLPRPKTSRDMNKRATVRKLSQGRFEEKVDMEILNGLLLDFCVVEWDGIVRDGAPFPCNAENRRVLDDNWREFSTTWNAIVGTGKQAAEQEEEDLEKN